MPKLNELLLEIFSEEIPALMQKNAASNLLDAFLKKVNELWKHCSNNINSISFVTPRRIGFHVTDIPTEQLIEEEIRGPRIGAPKQALDGFLGRYDLDNVGKLEEKNGFWVYKKNSNSNVIDTLKSLLEEILCNFVWPKSMRWSTYDTKWIRPIHSILCLFNDKSLPIKFGHLTASNISYGHRFIREEPIVIDNISEYYAKLRQASVLLSPEERRQKILTDVTLAVSGMDLQLIADEDLLGEIVGLVENPVIFIGQIDKHFMALPEEVLITTLKLHQKYLMLQDMQGKVASYFVIVSNIEPHDGGNAIVSGNEKVVRARLTDAEFFITQDCKKNLDQYAAALSKVTFHSSIGNMHDKVERMKDIAVKLAEMINMNLDTYGVSAGKVVRAVELCKNDLVTGMVKEFPELQGIMGYYYALYQGEDIEVARAIREHHKPRGPEDAVPIGLISAIVAMADKLDTLNQMFGAGIKPTGSKDPYALRRAALGVIRIISANCLNVSLKALEIRNDVLDFIAERLKNLETTNYSLTFIKNALQC
ncbi:Glycine--tRNA ligase beta subunit [Alphaproteobacteria bacterium]